MCLSAPKIGPTATAAPLPTAAPDAAGARAEGRLSRLKRARAQGAAADRLTPSFGSTAPAPSGVAVKALMGS